MVEGEEDRVLELGGTELGVVQGRLQGPGRVGDGLDLRGDGLAEGFQLGLGLDGVGPDPEDLGRCECCDPTDPVDRLGRDRGLLDDRRPAEAVGDALQRGADLIGVALEVGQLDGRLGRGVLEGREVSAEFRG